MDFSIFCSIEIPFSDLNFVFGIPISTCSFICCVIFGFYVVIRITQWILGYNSSRVFYGCNSSSFEYYNSSVWFCSLSHIVSRCSQVVVILSKNRK